MDDDSSSWRARPDGAAYGAARRRLVEAAEAVVRDDGVASLRLGSVAEAAGFHRSSVYRYFDSKEDLVTAVVVHRTLHVGQAVIEQLGSSAPPERFLAEGLSVALVEMATDPVLRSLMAPSSSEWMSRISGPALTEGIRPLVEPLFAEAAARGALRPGMTPEQALQWLQIVAQGLVRSPEVVAGPEQLVELLEAVLVPALFTGPDR